MDMKKILQALDTASAKPVEGSNDMKKFVSIVNEGANPHKVALPVQMAMQHYQKQETTRVVKKDTVIGKYFQQVEESTLAEQAQRKQLMKQYAQKISQRVLEGRWGRMDAYDRDYQSSISGMSGRRREVDDEANLMYWYDNQSGRLKQKMVDVRDERSAKAEGWRYEQKDALRVANIIRSKFDPKKWVQKQGTQWIQVFPFGKPDEINKEQ